MQQAMMQNQSALQQAMYSPTQTATAGGLGSLYTSTTGTTNAYVSLTTATQATTSTISVGNSLMNALYASQGQQMLPGNSALVHDTLRLMGECAIADGEPCKVRLPDGGMLEVDADGSYRINDKDAKVIYRANRMRDFNSFINASDKLELFIRFCGAMGVKQDEMLDIPVKHFIAWLVVEAALADAEDVDVVVETKRLTDALKIKPRCRCGRFIPRKLVARKITFCRPVCLERELAA